jgi:hypothetical protein
MSELVSQAVHDLLAFYKENCPEVRFGDLDLRTLERTVASIDEAAQKVIEAEEAVAQARVQFREVEAGLLGKVNRTLSFLKIFVDEDAEQQAKLELIASGLPGAARRKAKSAAGGTGEAKPRRRRKSKDGEEGDAQDPPENAVEAALQKAGIFDEEEAGEDEALKAAEEEIDEISEAAAAPIAAKKGSKK